MKETDSNSRHATPNIVQLTEDGHHGQYIHHVLKRVELDQSLEQELVLHHHPSITEKIVQVLHWKQLHVIPIIVQLMAGGRHSRLTVPVLKHVEEEQCLDREHVLIPLRYMEVHYALVLLQKPRSVMLKIVQLMVIGENGHNGRIATYLALEVDDQDKELVQIQNQCMVALIVAEMLTRRKNVQLIRVQLTEVGDHGDHILLVLLYVVLSQTVFDMHSAIVQIQLHSIMDVIVLEINTNIFHVLQPVHLQRFYIHIIL